MSKIRNRFKILLCGKKELMDRLRTVVARSPEIHLQYASSPGFLPGRALFNAPDLVIIDSASDAEILREAVRKIHSQLADTSIFLISTSANHHQVVEMMKLGATDYFVFPNDNKKLNDQIRKLFDEWAIVRSQENFTRLQKKAFDFDQIVGNSPRLTGMLERAKKVIENTSLTVLITGETGTGKEL
ncbi:MAG TPA: sigma 54-interacting transcriptional regulator, partial [Bacteroidota bacterium]|nr:sigma 54-interacting transcriptional regulator [Bacteroidota bacterium]